MLMIVVHHFCVHALYPDMKSLAITSSPWTEQVALLLQCFVFIGVNCFVMLSGWYGIHLKARSVVNLWTICLFYALVRWAEKAVYHLHDGVNVFGWEYISPVLLPFSHTPMWYIPCYVVLLLLSPLLNSAIGSFSRRRYEWVLVLATVVNIWFGYGCAMDNINDDGFTAAQFVWLYLIGGYLRRYCGREWLHRHRQHCLWVYVGCSLLWGALSIWEAYCPGIPLWMPFTYNNPLVMGASVGFFLFAQSFTIRSKVVNWLAVSTLAVYLVQEGIFRYRWLPAALDGCSPTVQLLLLLPISVVFMLVVLLADKGRLLLMRPFWKLYDAHIEPRLNAVIRRIGV